MMPEHIEMVTINDQYAVRAEQIKGVAASLLQQNELAWSIALKRSRKRPHVSMEDEFTNCLNKRIAPVAAAQAVA